ncbi:helix-turn-helix transcriptional regulator [Tenacibaculum ovolyticum]|uniref:helix-turn-helix domain-containing protein n=1 Tax=Tenacibaculum ovolyticum TaxID=104270 RepID=UPI0022F3B53C|nr:helix-turn-helix transcriptional regulator [Tenacibaculum ovolyticum]WBX76772.1 helix-turn-helix transcriptional regulator [Tenacibaculum ovolyticum]
MMNINNHNKIEWNSPEVLMQLVKNIEAPLTSIIKANSHFTKKTKNFSKENTNNVIFSNSQEIKNIIDEILKKVNVDLEVQPLIFDIYNSNERVQSMCKKVIDPSKISKSDTKWLKKMENEVYDKITQKDINLYDLSFKLAVSERQLHRKINTLLHLTPNKYVRILKLYKAKQIIDDYLFDSVSQVSYAVGYYDPHYFSKLFTRQYDATPKELLSELR